MKSKSLVLMLVLTAVAWAQTATPNAPQQNGVPAKPKCACCAKMASDAKDGQSCARHKMQNADGKETASCCSDKNGKSCGQGNNKDAKGVSDDKAAGCCSDCNKEKMAASCCGSKSASGAMDCGKSCCSGKNDKASSSCCRRMMQS